MRQWLISTPRYRNSKSWQARVKKMPANQVLAIYNKFLSSGMFNEKVETGYHQITIEEYLNEKEK